MRSPVLFEMFAGKSEHEEGGNGIRARLLISNEGKIVIFGGGLPIRRKGVVIGAIGTSASTVEQDIALAEAATGAIEPSIKSESVGVP